MHTHTYTQHSTTQSRLLKVLHRSPGEVRACITYTKQVEHSFLNIYYLRVLYHLRPAGISLSLSLSLAFLHCNAQSLPLISNLPFFLVASQHFVLTRATQVPLLVWYIAVQQPSFPRHPQKFIKEFLPEVRCTSKNNSAELHSICFCSEINLENNIKLENLLCTYYLPSMVIDLILSELWACLDVVGTRWEPLPSSGTSG